MTSLVASDLDKRVAEAVGDPFPRAHDWFWTGRHGSDVSLYCCTHCDVHDIDDGEPEHNPKHPCVQPYSTNLNAAFRAAERVGLFDGYQLGKWTSREFCIILACDQPSEGDIIGRGETPALAICEAILNLKEKK
jgi:hypothetical protein